MKPLALLLTCLTLMLAACSPLTPAGPAAPEPTGTPTAAVEPPPAVTDLPGEPPMASLDDEAFDQGLAAAIETREFEVLGRLMKASFGLSALNTSLDFLPPEEALRRLQDGPLAEGSAPRADFTISAADVLGGQDPLAMWGSVVSPVRAFYLTGLGPDAEGDGIAVIGRDEETGELYWLGLLLPLGARFDSPVPDPAAVVETEVQQVEALKDMAVYLGPGAEYDIVGQIRAGEIAQVTGASQDGGWWRIFCTNVVSGQCWLPADPALTRVVSDH